MRSTLILLVGVALVQLTAPPKANAALEEVTICGHIDSVSGVLEANNIIPGLRFTSTVLVESTKADNGTVGEANCDGSPTDCGSLNVPAGALTVVVNFAALSPGVCDVTECSAPPINVGNPCNLNGHCDFPGIVEVAPGSWVATGEPDPVDIVIQPWGLNTTCPACAPPVVDPLVGIDGAQAGTVSTGTGSGTFMLDPLANTLDFDITFMGLSSPETGAHIHGPRLPGVAGPVLYGLPAGSSKIGTITLMDIGGYTIAKQKADLTNPVAGGMCGMDNFCSAPDANLGNACNVNADCDGGGGLWYVNIHSMTLPGGEIRGQITSVQNSLVLGLLEGTALDMSISGTGNTNDSFVPDFDEGQRGAITGRLDVNPFKVELSIGQSDPFPLQDQFLGVAIDGIGEDECATFPVPATNWVGIVLLAAMLAGTSFWLVRRRTLQPIA